MIEDLAYLRAAEMKDKDLLLEWKNDEDVRKNSFNHTIISNRDHEKWFLSKLKDESCLLYIYIYGNIPVGQIRLDIEGIQGWINYSVDKNHRYHGHGERMLNMLEETLLQERLSIEFLCARVMKSNITSQKKFEQQKYHRLEREDYIEYMKSL